MPCAKCASFSFGVSMGQLLMVLAVYIYRQTRYTCTCVLIICFNSGTHHHSRSVWSHQKLIAILSHLICGWLRSSDIALRITHNKRPANTQQYSCNWPRFDSHFPQSKIWYGLSIMVKLRLNFALTKATPNLSWCDIFHLTNYFIIGELFKWCN